MRDRAYRRFKRLVKGYRRLKEDQLEHSADQPNNPYAGSRYVHYTLEKAFEDPTQFACACFSNDEQKFGRTFSRFADYPKYCQGYCCKNPRRSRWSKKEKLTLQERRFDESSRADWD